MIKCIRCGTPKENKKFTRCASGDGSHRLICHQCLVIQDRAMVWRGSFDHWITDPATGKKYLVETF